jgi:hypothetical protein
LPGGRHRCPYTAAAALTIASSASARATLHPVTVEV